MNQQAHGFEGGSSPPAAGTSSSYSAPHSIQATNDSLPSRQRYALLGVFDALLDDATLAMTTELEKSPMEVQS